MNTATSAIKRGDVFMAELPATVGVEQDKMRPVVIVSNNTANDFGDLVTVIPITTQAKKILPTHVTIQAVGKTMIVLCEQIRSIDKSRLENYKFTIDAGYMAEIEKSMKVQLGVKDSPTAQESLDIRIKKAEFICMIADDLEYADKRIFYDCVMELLIGTRVLGSYTEVFGRTPEMMTGIEDEPGIEEALAEDMPNIEKMEQPTEKQQPVASSSRNPLGRHKDKPPDGYYIPDIAKLLERPANSIWYIVKKLNLKTDKYGHWEEDSNRFIFNEAAVTEIMNHLNKEK